VTLQPAPRLRAHDRLNCSGLDARQRAINLALKRDVLKCERDDPSWPLLRSTRGVNGRQYQNRRRRYESEMPA
jgi:hypothetical protein